MPLMVKLDEIVHRSNAWYNRCTASLLALEWNFAEPGRPRGEMKGHKLSAELTWFHVFKAMIDDGEVAKIGASAFTTYCVIKSHTNFSTGVAFPSIETISEKSCIGHVVG